MPSIKVLNQLGQEVKELTLAEEVFGIEPNMQVVLDVVNAQRAGMRQGTADTKNRTEVSGGGKKPYRQKGTGRARQGSIRSPQWVGGGVVFGPTPRKYVLKTNKKVVQLATKSLLSDKLANNSLIVVDKFELAEAKTKNFIQVMDAIGANENKKIVVIPSKTVPQGITAVINFIPDISAEDNEEAMKDAVSTVKTGEVTYAVRDTVIDDVTIKRGDYMGIGDTGIMGVGSDIEDVTEMMLEKIADDSTELISLYYGSDIKEDEANAFCDRIASRFPKCDVEVQYGGQPIYYYIVSAE